MTPDIKRIIGIAAMSTVLALPLSYNADMQAAPAPQQSATKGKRGGTSKNTTTPAKGNTPAKGTTTAKGKTNPTKKGTAQPKGNTKTKGKGETSADVKKRQEATQKEIKETEARIRENERQVKNGLSALSKIEGDISTSKERIAATTGTINSLNGRITGLEKNISDNEGELDKLRGEYLKAVKRMRTARRGNSALAFIFASENFNQALRRMRYLRQFSEWKDRQSAAIDSATMRLRGQKETLAKARIEQSEALKRQQSEQTTLQQQYSQQDAILADLRKNGSALKTHLSKKQAEANQLKSRIAELIAQEEARRLAEEKARKEAEERARKEAEEKARKEAEEKARREAQEKERLLAEQKAADKAAKDKVAADNAAKEKAAADKTAKEKAAKEKADKEKAAKDKAVKDTQRNLAKTETPAKSAPTKPTPAKSAAATPAKSVGGDFSKMRGSLPKPVSGSFRVTSRFGRQSLPELPDIVYDNPGIDAEVAAGASALAVYGGNVSGVYMIPGYNTVIIVNHGNYYTVYGNIATPAVKVGDAVKAGQGLGSLARDEDDSSHSSIHFEVWRNREKLNPLDWLR